MGNIFECRKLKVVLLTLFLVSLASSAPQAFAQTNNSRGVTQSARMTFPGTTSNPSVAPQSSTQYDPKTGVKLDTRVLPPTSAHKAVYKPETEPIVVIGEVVDAWCYASQTMGAGHGPVHQHCAVACVGGGVTPGILDDKGMLWLCVKHKAFTGCKDLLFPFVARRVKVTGWAAHKGGCNVLKIEKVELISAAK